ncbi:MAG: bifunctional metallophosphatase/5'-nucleotidase [Spirochaetales bacterium]|nr:bifunctional metallophosphatase/5'-nucleotidase [Spirochaetales bacterium]
MRKGSQNLGIAALVAALLLIGCQTDDSTTSDVTYSAGPAVYTLQLLHFADIDGNEEIALDSVDEFSALVNGFKADAEYGASTLVLSSGDNLIPGPRFYAAEQSAVRAVTGSNEPGHGDIAFMNYFGVVASAMGNHDLDAGPGEFADAIQVESKNGVEFPGSLFPYLSSNLDWSTDEDMAGILGENGLPAAELKGKVAAYTFTEVNGEKIGIVGASTPILDTITNVGGITVNPVEDKSVQALAAVIQESVDGLSAMGINKIILIAHMQQIQIEMALAELLTDVDVIVAGGSNTRMGDSTDQLFPGDDAFEMDYPYTAADAMGMPTLVVNVDGDYKYLGRLVVAFDEAGGIVVDSLNSEVNGAYAATAENVAALGGMADERVVAVRDAINGVIEAQFGNVLGYTDVYLDGRRAQVRTQETNLGDLTADANLWYANLLSEVPVDVSIKNGGGIRTEIGSAVVPPGSTDYSEAVYSAPMGGGISEGHLKATLRFDNGLCTMNATAEELVMLLEHGVSETMEGQTPGKFPQISGMKMVFDASKEAGSRIVSLDITDADGTVKDTVVADGAIQGDSSRVFRLVTLNFLANGGDAYPYDMLSNPERRNLYDGMGYGEETDYPDENLAADPGLNTTFSYTGGEQDALAEYLMAFYPSADMAFSMEETDLADDMRIKY